MTPSTKQLVIAGSMAAITTSIISYIAYTFVVPSIQNVSLECNKTCMENAGGPMPTSGLLSISIIIALVGIIIGLLWHWGDVPKEEWDELVKGKKE